MKCSSPKVNSTTGHFQCPVRSGGQGRIHLKALCMLLPPLLTMLMISCCGGGEPDPGSEGSAGPAQPVLVTALETRGFLVEASPPDTISIRWNGEGSGTVESVAVEQGDGLQQQDTVASVVADIGSVLTERLGMEIDIASARLESSPEDTVLRSRLDSLTQLLDSLSLHRAQVVFSPLEGTVTELPMAEGDRVMPGQILAKVAVASRDLYLVSPPDGATIYNWPAGSDSVRFVEERPSNAVYSGDGRAVASLFSGLLTVDRTAVFESGMRSYVVTEREDTIYVTRVGEVTGGGIMLLPEGVVDGRLRTWAGGGPISTSEGTEN